MLLPYKVGLTGGIGSGKSTVSSMFSELGVPVIDADSIAHDLTAPGKPALEQIASIFGKEILDSTGHLQRKQLGSLVFSDSTMKHKLEAILHPLVYATMENMLEQIYAAYCILSVPLLLETGFRNMVDSILVVDSPVTLQIERVCNRDGVSPEQAINIINAQITREDRLKTADEIILNDGNLQQLAARIKVLHSKYLDAARQYKQR